MKKTTILMSATALVVAAGLSIAGEPAKQGTMPPRTTSMPAATGMDTILNTAVKAGTFNTLAKAIDAAGLTPALSASGPFTVFAPTDEAFAKLGADKIAMLLKPENKELLKSVLLFHVVPGTVMASDVSKLTFADTLNGQRVDVLAKDGVMIDKARVTKADIACSNGVIHVIDTVLMPETKNVVEVAVAAGKFTTLAKLIEAAGLTSTLTGAGPFTVFAPTDEAFAKLPAATLESLMKPENKQQLTDILTYHVVPGRVFANQVTTLQQVKTVQGTEAPIAVQAGAATIGNAKIVKTDIEASNGVIHVIDTVIMPKAR